MKKCQKTLIRYFLNEKIIITVIFMVLCSNTAFSQRSYKFKELPVPLQKSVLNSLQKLELDTNKIYDRPFIDTVTVKNPNNGNVWTLFNFVVYLDHDNDTTYVHINCIASPIVTGNKQETVKDFEDLFDGSRAYGRYYGYDRTYVTTTRLGFECADHTPHHSAMTLKEMKKLQDRYHCRKIIPMTIDGN